MRPTFEILSEVSALSEDQAGFGAVETERGRLPLKAMDLSGRITGLHFCNRLTQTFVNAYNEPLEATYIFPLPDRAAVVSFKIRVADRVIEGVLKEREEARVEYDQAIASGHRAAIAEEERPDVFTMRAGNISPGESMTVELELSGPLQFSDGEATYRFPLVVAPRYIPGMALDGASVGSGTAVDTDAVPDASRISPPVLLPGQPNPVHLTLSLDLDPAGLPLSNLRASLHDLLVEELEEGMFRVSLQPGATRLDRDFILRFQAGEEAVVTSLRILADEEGDGSTFALTVVPPTLKKCNQNPRDVVVVLDRSGSMSGWKMVAARRAASRIVDSLTVHDRFAVLLFDSVLEEPFETSGKLVEGSDRNRFKAVEFLARVEARGGTEIGPALARSLEYFKRGDGEGRERAVVFVTDGQVGNEAQVLEHASRGAAAGNVRLHTVGIDRAVNASFLSNLAGHTGGVFEQVESEERLDFVMQQIHRRIGHPVLCSVELQFPDQVMSELTPERADVFPGVPLVLSGRLLRPAPAQATVLARLPDGKAWQKKVKGQKALDPVLRHVWARARVLDMQNALDAGRGAHDLGDKITEFSLRWNVLCRFTAFVAVDRSEVANPSGRVHQVTQAVAAPSGWDHRAMPMPCAAPAGSAGGLGGLVGGAPMKPLLGGRWGEPGRARMRGGSPPPSSPPPPPGAILESLASMGGEGWLGGSETRSKREESGAGWLGQAPREDGSLVRDGAGGPGPVDSETASRVKAEARLRDSLPELDKALTLWKKGNDPQRLQDACRWLEEIGLGETRRLAEQGREAWKIFTEDQAAGLKLLEAWVDALYRYFGKTRRKSWWKR